MKTYITETTLSEAGFEKRANMWFRGRVSISLIQGHTWELDSPNSKYGVSVRTIEEIEEKVK